MENGAIFGWALLWILTGGILGGSITPRIYARKDLDISQASLGGAVIGAALHLFGLIPLWIWTPKLRTIVIGAGGAVVVGILAGSLLWPTRTICVWPMVGSWRRS
ncbi:MAG: hypothetical protein R2856_11545 [Caldilineaceae bacterium]